jgi:hypothetical protein
MIQGGVSRNLHRSSLVYLTFGNLVPMNERWEEAFQRAVLEGKRVRKFPRVLSSRARQIGERLQGLVVECFVAGEYSLGASCVVVSCSLSKGCRGNARDYGQLLPLSSQ